MPKDRALSVMCDEGPTWKGDWCVPRQVRTLCAGGESGGAQVTRATQAEVRRWGSILAR